MKTIRKFILSVLTLSRLFLSSPSLLTLPTMPRHRVSARCWYGTRLPRRRTCSSTRKPSRSSTSCPMVKGSCMRPLQISIATSTTCRNTTSWCGSTSRPRDRTTVRRSRSIWKTVADGWASMPQPTTTPTPSGRGTTSSWGAALSCATTGHRSAP